MPVRDEAAHTCSLIAGEGMTNTQGKAGELVLPLIFWDIYANRSRRFLTQEVDFSFIRNCLMSRA